MAINLYRPLIKGVVGIGWFLTLQSSKISQANFILPCYWEGETDLTRCIRIYEQCLGDIVANLDIKHDSRKNNLILEYNG